MTNRELNTEFHDLYKQIDNSVILNSYINVSSDIATINDYINKSNEFININKSKNIYDKSLNDIYYGLKNKRYLRNKLSHDISFDDTCVKSEDINWLRDFESKLLNGTDPLRFYFNKKPKVQPAYSSNNKTNSVAQKNDGGCLTWILSLIAVFVTTAILIMFVFLIIQILK